MEHSHSLGQPQFGRIVDTGDRVELRLLISALEHPDTATEMTVVSWSRGNTNLVISVPHGGTIGALRTLTILTVCVIFSSTSN